MMSDNMDKADAAGAADAAVAADAADARLPEPLPTALEARGITVSLGGAKVLHGIDFAARSGQVIAVIGPNGAGKSTMLRALAGLIETDSGEIDLGGSALSELPRREIARRLAYLPQQRLVHWPIAVRGLVGLGRQPYQTFGRGDSRRDREAIDAAMAAMDVARFAARPLSQLSGGELARVLLARALAQEPKVLLADEPTAALDPAHQLALFEHMSRIAAAGCAVVVALHDLSLAARFCDGALLLKDGRRVASGSASEVFTEATLSQAYDVEMRVAETDGIPAIVPLSARA